jgi:hypothetical protein
MKAYEKLGLTSDDVIEIQKWMFPMIEITEHVSDIIMKVTIHFTGTKQHYALYLLGCEMGQAKVKEHFGLQHILNPENI